MIERHVLGLSNDSFQPELVGIVFIATIVLAAITWGVNIWRYSEVRSEAEVGKYVFFLVSFGVYAVGITQVIVGRGDFWPLSERHTFFPLLGLYSAIFLLLTQCVEKIGFLARPVTRFKSIIAGIFIILAFFSAARFNMNLDLTVARNVNSDWRRFFKGLDRMICAVRDPEHKQRLLPDLPVSQIPGKLKQQFPFTEGAYGFSLSFLARMGQSACYNMQNIKFIDPNEVVGRDWSNLCKDRKSNQCRFFKRYFPEFHSNQLIN